MTETSKKSDAPAVAPAVGRPWTQWVGLASAVLIISILCAVAAQWQWHRHEARAQRAQQVTAHYDSPPVPLVEVMVPSASGTQALLPQENVWRQVRAKGQYAPEYTVLLRNRPVNSQHVFHVLVPFETTTGQVIVINRGLVPMDDGAAAPDHIPAPPVGEVEVVFNIRADEPLVERGAPPQQVQSINVAHVLQEGGGSEWAKNRTLPAYGIMRSEIPAATETIVILPAPSISLGSHLAYTWQWIMFAIGIWVAFFLLLIRERRDIAVGAADADIHVPSDSTRRPRAGSAEDEEDALIDEQLRSG